MTVDGEGRERLLQIYEERLDAYPNAGPEYRQRWRQWCRILLSHGGSLVVPPAIPESDLDALIADASTFPPEARSVPGQSGACHHNVAVLWIDGEVASIGTGYARSDDGLWRQHSWGVDADGVVVETTFERLAYVGITVPARVASIRFAGSNAGEHLQAVLRERGPRAKELVTMIRELARIHP